jgi:hypothetical protein
VHFYRLVRAFAALNPHASFRYTPPHHGAAVEFAPADTRWRKWLPTQKPSPHWYDLPRFRSLVAGELARGRRDGTSPTTLRDFIGANFCGLSGTVVRSELLRECELDGATLDDLFPSGTANDTLLAILLARLKKYSRPVTSDRLGVIGQRNLTHALLTHFDTREGTVRYRAATFDSGGVPHVLEVAFAVTRGGPREVVAGVNWSPSRRPPFGELDWLLSTNRVNHADPCVVVAHLACPRPEFTDTGKTILRLPAEGANALAECVQWVTARWKKAKQKAERESSRREALEERELREMERREKAGFLTIKAASVQVIEESYRQASGEGSRPANARQVMYANRRLVLQAGLTNPEGKGGGYFKRSSSFTQGVLPDFLEANPEVTKDWDVVFDDRGHFAEPHTGLQIGIGTLAVRDYLAGWTRKVTDARPSVTLPWEVDTCGPANRFKYALFVEKEGFDSLLDNARIQERYDVARMSTKGMSVTAARQLVERLSHEGVTVLVLHDFDKWGLSILHTLRSNTRRYKYRKRPKVIDLGLRLKDVTNLGLTGERVSYGTKADPRENLRESGATRAECNFLVSGGGPRRWKGQRVELNELTSPQFIDFLEAKLAAVGAKKVVPEGEALAAAYRLQVKRVKLQRAIDEAAKGIDDEALEVPADLREKLAERIEGEPISWDQALWRLVNHEDKRK